MGSRLQLQALLETLRGDDPDVKIQVYFQPPTNVKMVYPCILYPWDDEDIVHADNEPYRHKRRYLVTVIDEDPDSEIPGLVAKLPTANFNRRFVADNMNHTAYYLHF